MDMYFAVVSNVYERNPKIAELVEERTERIPVFGSKIIGLGESNVYCISPYRFGYHCQG